MAKKVKPGKLRGNTTPNLLTDDPNDFILQLIGGMKYSLADIVQLVLLDGATVKTAQDLEESFRMVMEKGIEMSLMGNNVSLDYIQMRASVSGVFNSSTEPFSRPKHQVNPVLTAGQAYLEAAHNTLVDNMGPAQNNLIAEAGEHGHHRRRRAGAARQGTESGRQRGVRRIRLPDKCRHRHHRRERPC